MFDLKTIIGNLTGIFLLSTCTYVPKLLLLSSIILELQQNRKILTLEVTAQGHLQVS